MKKLYRVTFTLSLPEMSETRVDQVTGERKQTKICVYCGSSSGSDPAHIEAARELGRLMAENNIGLGEYPG